MLLVFGVAVAGVLVEAFAPRAQRRPLQLALSLGGLAAAFVLTILVAATSSLFADGAAGHVAAMGAVAVDGPTLFIWGTILVLAFVSVMLIAESSPGRRARSWPRRPPRRAAPRNGPPSWPARRTPRSTR